MTDRQTSGLTTAKGKTLTKMFCAVLRVTKGQPCSLQRLEISNNTAEVTTTTIITTTATATSTCGYVGITAMQKDCSIMM